MTVKRSFGTVEPGGQGGGAAPVRSTVSANIKTKRKVAALFKTTA